MLCAKAERQQQWFICAKAKRQQQWFICAKAKRQQQWFICAKAERQQQWFICAKAERQHQSAQSERKSTTRYGEKVTCFRRENQAIKKDCSNFVEQPFDLKTDFPYNFIIA
ncbi:hypothetical protein AN161_19430 [Lysinibacillus sp. FJAT-14222]|nr:hypothetical protein AN161_19430 [Lysinibacillus sp. FJAT-14222]